MHNTLRKGKVLTEQLKKMIEMTGFSKPLVVLSDNL